MLCVVFRIGVFHFFLYIRRSIYVAISVMYSSKALMMYGITICIVSTLLPRSGFSASLLRRGVNKLGPTLDFVVQL